MGTNEHTKKKKKLKVHTGMPAEVKTKVLYFFQHFNKYFENWFYQIMEASDYAFLYLTNFGSGFPSQKKCTYAAKKFSFQKKKQQSLLALRFSSRN